MIPPTSLEYPTARYFAEYLNFNPTDSYFQILQNQYDFIENLCKNLSTDELNFKYQPDKWSIKELIGHLTDSEKIFSYRALAIARGDQSKLPSFDENLYVTNAQFQNLSNQQIWNYYRSTRQATLDLLHTLNPNMLQNKGNANGHQVTANTLFWMIAGHEKHHIHVINERYLPVLNKIL